MSRCTPHISAVIEQKGAITVAEYMQLALQHPEFGYYRHGDPLARGGDFVTAPEISQMFGEMIGLWCADIWRQLGQPKEFALLEMGPGRGTLMQDALRATAKIPGFHEALSLYLLESSDTLRNQQKEKLKAFFPVHIADFSELPAIPLLCIANEFFDALPIRQFEKSFTGWCERLVTLQDAKFVFTLSQPDPAIKLLIPDNFHQAHPGTVLELSPVSVNLMRDVARRIAEYGGAALVVDYGYAASDGKPTLQAVAKHRYSGVLADPGDADITALVDFGMLRQAAGLQGTRTHGIVGQGVFLQALGIELRADQLKLRATAEQKAAIDAALRRLTDAAEMGSLFKVLAVSSPQLENILGF